MAEGAEAAYLVAGGTGATAFEIEGTATLKLEGARKGVPQKVLDVVDDIRLNKGAPPRGFKGGRTFKNDGRGGGQILPENATYKEYDVNPYIKGQNRGAERVVIGDDGSVWYTNDHYQTFTRIQ